MADTGDDAGQRTDDELRAQLDTIDLDEHDQTGPDEDPPALADVEGAK